MSDNSAIEWTDATWSPTLGCTKVSPGCDNCYAIKTVHRLSFNPNPKIHEAAEGLTAYRPGHGVVWTGAVRTLPDRLDLPLTWRKPRMIFVDSQSDLFHDHVPDEFIARVFAVMGATPRHTYQVLTKRHGRMRSLLSSDEFRRLVKDKHSEMQLGGVVPYRPLVINVWPLPNVWLGVSVEDQKRADIRVPALLDTPAAVRWLSCEPLLGPVDVSFWFEDDDAECTCTRYVVDYSDPERFHPSNIDREDNPTCRMHHPLNWVVAGGESGPGARPMHPDWARSLRDQCTAAKVPYHFKQWGAWSGIEAGGHSAFDYVTDDDRCQVVDMQGQVRGRPWPGWAIQDGTRDAAVMRRYSKKDAGRVLDGRTWDEFPLVSVGDETHD